MKKIILVDDHILFREGLASVLNRQADFQVIGQAGTAHESVKLVKELHPDIVLMDFGLPDGSGVEATRAIMEEWPEMTVVFLTVYDSDETLLAAIRSGAKGYILKIQPATQLLASLRAIDRGEAAISRVMSKKVMDELFRLGPTTEPRQSKLSKLTLREFEILQAVAARLTNREIAVRFEVSETTVKNQVHSILSKLGLKNRRDVVWFARQHGIGDSKGRGQS